MSQDARDLGWHLFAATLTVVALWLALGAYWPGVL